MKQLAVAKTIRTTDYKRFKFLTGNRGVSKSRIEKIKKSLDTVGYIPTRIIVNQNFEIIDGQCRFVVFREYQLPLYVDVVPGAGVEECRFMNINQSNWTTMDYIKSYADEGNESYKWLLTLITRFKQFGSQTVIAACNGKASGSANDSVRDGRFKMTRIGYELAAEKLEWAIPMMDALKYAGGRTLCYFVVAFFAYDMPDVNNDLFRQRVIDYKHLLRPAADTAGCAKSFEEVYNKRRSRGKYVYIAHEYEKWSKEGWTNG